MRWDASFSLAAASSINFLFLRMMIAKFRHRSPTNHVINGASKVGLVVHTASDGEKKSNGSTPVVSEKRKPPAEAADTGTPDIC